jgi:hypothetical protein
MYPALRMGRPRSPHEAKPLASSAKRRALRLRALALRALVVLLVLSSAGAALAVGPQLVVRFQPTDRTQLAVWVERADGTFMGTLALTHAVAKAGIGNRPGALQLNSGYRWPYGRREGVLPVWAHARLRQEGAQPFKRVIFQKRRSEGFVSRTTEDQSRDDYYCLSFAKSTTTRDALDAVTCASVFSSDKGRFMGDADLSAGYAEPYESAPGRGAERPLSLSSLYPPRRDLSRCADASCFDHPDVALFATHALDVMPELDAVTQATPQGHTQRSYRFSLPETWPKDDDYVLYVEANTEGDYGSGLDAARFPTPKNPASDWDVWSQEFGYPYRGQPSVVYAVPFRIDEPGAFETFEAVGTGALEGEDGELHPLEGNAVDDPVGAPGSGADRLEAVGDSRIKVTVSQPDAARCASAGDLPAVQGLRVLAYPDRAHAHTWATLEFDTPRTTQLVGDYEVLVRADGGSWEPAFTPDSRQELLPVALDMCGDPDHPGENRCTVMGSGTPLSVVLAGLQQTTRYTVRVTAVDDTCGSTGAPAEASFETPAREFATVSPCFVATAAYGSPLASEVSVLRAFRDRHLLQSAIGRAFVRTYYAAGPTLAEQIRDRPWLRASARALLAPVVALIAWWEAP